MIYYPTAPKKMDLLFLENLHFFLKKYPHSILREIKREFKNVSQLDEKLDYFIENNWILRRDKRYETTLEEFSTETFEEFFSKESSFISQLEKLDLNVIEAFEGMTIKKNSVPFVIDEKDYLELRNFLFTKKELTSEKFEVTIFQNELPGTTLANYFEGRLETESLKKAYDLLGDVTATYYLDQTLGKLYRSKEKPLVESRKDIFTDSLYLFDLLNEKKIAKVLFSDDFLIDEVKIATLIDIFQKEVGQMSEFYQEVFKGKILKNLFANKRVNFNDGTLTFIKKNRKKRS